MNKVILPDGWCFDQMVVQPIKWARDGLRGEDLRLLIKQAGYEFADRVKRARFQPGDIPILLLAMGATEFFGPNRNGDGFREEVCKKYHPTFVKNACYFYNHANKDKKKSYGFVQDSYYHPDMHRVELLVCLNGTKEAADRNGGFVAEKDLQDLAAGRDIPVSMACKVAYDVCSGCGNRARTREEYCTDRTCRYGGLRENITKVAADGHILHADNPEPVFFDISRVFRPADRIAYVLGRVKAAAAGEGIGGAALAEIMGVDTPARFYGDHECPGVKLAYELAEIERHIEKEGSGGWSLAFAREVQPETTWHDHDGRVHQALAALAGEKIAMPLEGFLKLAMGDSLQAGGAVEAIASRLPGVYSRMVEDGSVDKLAANNPFVPSGEMPPARVRHWAAKRAAAYSVAREHADRRVKVAAVRRAGQLTEQRASQTIKVAGDAEGMARAYALYKLGFLQAVAGDSDFQLTADLAVRQNYSI